MSVSKKKKPATKDSPSAELRSSSIKSEVEDFLSSGKKIEEIPVGVSGMNEKPSRHIVISRK